MNQQQIKQAQVLFYERDRLQKLRDDAESKGGLKVAVLGTYQDEEVEEAARAPVLKLIGDRLRRIEGDLKQLGWDGK
ncbi:hypothetical protein [Pseudomonas oryzihabitans]|uniref:hypothetical protein n=1 Tax=Pseudomonas oryzihabitans TaxID=47885 RepID=UPI0011217B17|nr:hypothetical protein [Pseudomonas psychrotolerans]QDD91923.1 hypothetical protein CCZ28_24085 [Pseudomonas psychrotolerans]